MTTFTSNPEVAQYNRGLSVMAERVMAATIRNFRNKIIGVIVAAVLAPQASFAGGHGGGGGMSHGGHSSGSSMRSMPRASGPSKSFSGGMKTQTIQKSPSNTSGTGKKVVTAKNGNSGINGAGLPKGNNANAAGKQRGTNIRDLMKVDSGSKVAGTGPSATKGKFSKSELLAKYGVKNNGIMNKGNKNPSSNPKNPSTDPKHMDHWCHNGFPWFWGIYPPIGFYPSCPTVISQPTPAYVVAPVAESPAISPQPLDTQTVSQPIDAQGADASAQVVSSQPTTVMPVDATVSTALPNATAADSVDLVLEEVRLVEPATVSAGPAYRVKFRNQGTQAAGKFRVGAFAEHDNKLSDDAPQIVTEVASLAAGDASEVTLRLPVSAMRLVSTSSAGAGAFDQLLVILDLDDAVVESEKSNNVVNLERTELEAGATL